MNTIETALPVQENNTQFRVPLEVANKFEVQYSNQTVEEIISLKLTEDTFDKEEAFYIIDLGTIIKKWKQWTNCLPRVKPYYAMKCNNNPAIIKTLANLGTGFDCASKAEIQQILGSGISASRIIYANPTKMVSHIEYAKSSEVDLMTFDNIHELEKIAQVFPTARLVLRIITDDSQSVCKFSTKFGAPLEQCPIILQRAKELGINVVGLSFHVGSGCMSTTSFVQAIRSAHSIFREAAKIGFNFNLLDIGGGWPGTDDGTISFPEIASRIAPVLDELFPPEVQLIAEPGRFFVAESHTLAVNVFAKRTMISEHGKEFLYYINDGVYQSFNCILFDHVQPTPLVFQPGNRKETYKCTIFGPTCDSMDCVAKGITHLPELEVGEWLYFKNMGAYTVAAASSFNGFKAHPILHYIESPVNDI